MVTVVVDCYCYVGFCLRRHQRWQPRSCHQHSQPVKVEFVMSPPNAESPRPVSSASEGGKDSANGAPGWHAPALVLATVLISVAPCSTAVAGDESAATRSPGRTGPEGLVPSGATAHPPKVDRAAGTLHRAAGQALCRIVGCRVLLCVSFPCVAD